MKERLSQWRNYPPRPSYRTKNQPEIWEVTPRTSALRLELGAKKFHEQRTTGPLLFESAPAPPSAGFNVTFEDWTLDTAAGAPLIFARLTAVTTKLL